MSQFALNGTVAVVTGSSRGIGRAIAEEIAANGGKVVVSSRKIEACEAVARDLNLQHGAGTAVAIAASISDKSALQALVTGTHSTFGRIDVLVCNAASNPFYGSMAAITDDQFLKVFTNNVLATNWLIQMVAPEMIERRDGSIVVISSIGAMIGSSTIGAYNISKAADLQLVRNLAVEFGKYNIRVNAITPGVIRTKFAKAIWENPAAEAAIKRATPLGRIGEPQDVAGAAVFLASRAGAYVTGQTITVDGGTIIGGGF